MQIVIEIDEEDYYRIASGFGQEEDALLLEKIFKNGTVLPEHGRLIDADALIKEYGKYDIGVFVNKAPTILEAWGNDDDKPHKV